MSKERELLVRCRAAINIRYDQVMLIRLHHEVEILLGEIEELLDQPEQTEQEPDYYLWHDEVHEQHPTNEGDPDVYPLYTAPPKREPLSDEKAHEICQNRTFLGGTLMDLLRDVEKAHGIGGE
jgi:hypothetical protein